MNIQQRSFQVASDMDLACAVVGAGELALAVGFDAAGKARVATATSELARNLLKYAGSGLIRVRRVKQAGVIGIEIVAEDKGPGIADPEAAVMDHVSSGGTLGLGLPGVRRLMDDFEMTSALGEGTRVMARLWV